MAHGEAPTSGAFTGFAGLCAILAGVSGFLYAIAFLIVARAAPEAGRLLSPLFLMLGGFFSAPALVALYQRLRTVDEGFALWALLAGVAGAVGSAIHGGFDLANAIYPPAAFPADLPSQVNPRGLLTFGFTGLALFAFSWLIARSRNFPRGLGGLGYFLAILLVILYLGRLIVLTPSSPVILVPAVVTGFILNPAWYIWLGLALWRENP
ncbi:MAG: hypothetical protein HY660_04500 [Armatimonadetes bacterium]|nr:hypothetical protein [Armatimonadota bacterium]